MESISLSRKIAAPEGSIRDAILDIAAFMRVAEFDEGPVADATAEEGRARGGRINIANGVDFLRIELSLAAGRSRAGSTTPRRCVSKH